ncbi:MAG: CoA-binding protein [Fidelibacterota bacterium]
MAILIDGKQKILVQGITGREGMARTKLMLDYCTDVVAGVTPGKGGMSIHGVPVYDTVEEAMEREGEIHTSVIFVPAPLVKDAALESIDSGIKLLVIIPDRVPIYDVLEINHYARESGARFLGPNTLGCLSVGKGVLGMIGGRASAAKEWFKKGVVGVASRSGGITSSIAYYLSKNDIGLTTIVHAGGDAVVGLPLPEILMLFQEDDETAAVVMFGEIGTSQEEQVAELIVNGRFNKPLIAFIGGAAAKEGTRFSHAGAIVEGERGSHSQKVKLLKEAGAYVVESFDDIPEITREVLSSLKLM